MKKNFVVTVACTSILLCSLTMLAQHPNDDYLLSAVNGTKKKIFKPNRKVVLRTHSLKLKGYLKAAGTDSLYVFRERNNNNAFTKIAVTDVTRIKGVYTTTRVVIVGLMIGCFGGIFAEAPRPTRGGPYHADEESRDNIFAASVVGLFFSTIALPITYMVEKESEKQTKRGWTFQLEKRIVTDDLLKTP